MYQINDVEEKEENENSSEPDKDTTKHMNSEQHFSPNQYLEQHPTYTRFLYHSVNSGSKENLSSPGIISPPPIRKLPALWTQALQ